MKSKKWDWLICTLLAAVLLIFVMELPNTAPQARVYPMVVLGGSYLMIAIALGGWAWAKKNKTMPEEESLGKKRTVRIVIYCIAILAYIILIDKLGFIVSTVVFGIFSLIYMQNKNKIVIVVLPIVVTAVLYYVFTNFLFVTLPSGILI
ncbi:MAG: hypothetical protein HFG20_05830 [Anaerotruncus sp.]|nr:hypothetical protein [Anaerotruncus sp.]